jgi:hypothetical protein
MKNKSGAVTVIFTAVLSLLFLSSFLWNTEVLHMESASFLCNYTAERPLLNIIFDPLNNDWGLYQGRELSYFIDYLDANFIALCAKRGIAHFYSLSFYIIAILIIAVQQYYGNLLFRNLSRIEIFAGTCLMISLPAFVLNGSFFRSAKPLCTLFLCLISYLTLLLYYRGMILKKRNNNLLTGIIIALELLLVLSDKQGVFFTAAFGMILALFLAFGFALPKLSADNKRSLRLLTFGTAGVILFSVLYNGLICPHLIYSLNGYYPAFDFQKPPAGGFAALAGGLAVFFRFIGTIAGGSGLWGGIIIIVAVLFMLGVPLCGTSANFTRRRPKQRFYIFLTFGLLFAAIAVMFILMAARLPALADLPELISSSYIMPVMTVLFFFIMLALDCLPREKKKLYGAAAATLFLILSLLNVMMVPHYLDLARKGHMKSCYIKTPVILQMINSGNEKIQEPLLPAEILLVKRLSKKQSRNNQ